MQNMMYIMMDISGAMQYTDPAQFQVQGNRERKKTKIINSLIEIIKEIMGI